MIALFLIPAGMMFLLACLEGGLASMLLVCTSDADCGDRYGCSVDRGCRSRGQGWPDRIQGRWVAAVGRGFISLGDFVA